MDREPAVTHRGVKLTAYFGERETLARSRFLADAMLDLFDHNNVATSVMLRGIAGFGSVHTLRSDQSLSLSEDPPVCIAAVDCESKMRGLVDDVVAMTTRGLVTLEKAQLLRTGDSIVDTGHHTAKLTVYVGRQQRIGGFRAYYAICDLLHQRGFIGATVLLGVDGTAHGQRYRARFFSRNVDVPLMIIATGTLAQAQTAAAELSAVLPQALLTIEPVQLCKHDGRLAVRPAQLPNTDDQGRAQWQKIMVHTSEATQHDGAPIHRALVRRLLQSRTARGATVLRGIWGFHGNHEPHGDKLFQLSRQVPVTTIIIDTPESITRNFGIVDELTSRHGLVTSETVPSVWSPADGSHPASHR